MKILFELNKAMQQRQLEKKNWIFPIKLAMYATHLRDQGHTIYWDGEDDGSFERIVSSESDIDVPFTDLPMADRVLTDGKNRKWQNNGNFKFHPGTYIQVADGCWHGRCTFCIEQDRGWVVRKQEDTVKELEYCLDQGYKEVFDDSGTFPVGKWLTKFCLDKMHSRAKDLPLSCNMRLGVKVDYKLMKQAGFRMILCGIESANQKTLDKLKKYVKIEHVIDDLKKANDAGLEPHITAMFGYPWESDSDEKKTLALVHYLLRKGYAKTAQASLYDVQGMAPIDRGNVKRIYDVGFTADFWFRKFLDLRSWADVKYLLRGVKEGIIRD